MLGIKRLETQRGFPSNTVNALLRHQETVAQDNCYSEEIFTRVADGRLPRSWRDKTAINAVRIEVITMAGIAPPPPPTPTTSS